MGKIISGWIFIGQLWGINNDLILQWGYDTLSLPGQKQTVVTETLPTSLTTKNICISTLTAGYANTTIGGLAGLSSLSIYIYNGQSTRTVNLYFICIGY